MVAVDFSAWVQPNLDIPLGGKTYSSPPPSVERAKQIIALAVLAEIRLGLYRGEFPDELKASMDAVNSAGEDMGAITLSPEVHQEMVEDGVAASTIERVAYYAMFYWARGKDRADYIAQALWGPEDDDEPGESESR